MKCKYCGGEFLVEKEHHKWVGTVSACPLCVSNHPQVLIACHERSGRQLLEVPGKGRSIGIEVEANPTLAGLYRATMAGAKVTLDGSLRGRAYEIVSPILRESNYREWVESVFKGFGNTPYSRQGLHVWIGLDEMSWLDLYNIMLYCRKFEPDFFSLVSPSRKPGGHNKSSGLPLPLDFSSRPVTTKVQLLQMLYGSSSLRAENYGRGKGRSVMKADKRCNCNGGGTVNFSGPITRYWWLNVHGFFHRKAIEIRLHQGTSDPEKICNWIEAWLAWLPIISKKENRPPLDLLPPGLSDYYMARRDFYGSMSRSFAGAPAEKRRKMLAVMGQPPVDMTDRKFIA